METKYFCSQGRERRKKTMSPFKSRLWKQFTTSRKRYKRFEIFWDFFYLSVIVVECFLFLRSTFIKTRGTFGICRTTKICITKQLCELYFTYLIEIFKIVLSRSFWSASSPSSLSSLSLKHIFNLFFPTAVSESCFVSTYSNAWLWLCVHG